MRNSQKRKGIGKKTILIIVDGETEIWYIQMLNRYEKLPGLAIKPELHKRKKLKDQFEIVKENADIYDKVIWILDLDVILNLGIITELKGYIETLTHRRNVQVLINTPCLEFWFLQHVRNSGAYYAECEAVNSLLRRHDPLTNYQKSGRYFTSSGSDIYRRLRPYLETAIGHAKLRGSFDINQPQSAKAEIYKLFGLLGIIME